MFQSVNKETFGCPVVFYEEMIAMFWKKMFQIDTEIDKNLKTSNFRRFYAIFFQVFERLRGFEW